MSRAEKTLVILIPGFPENEADTTCLPMQQSFVRTVKELHPGLHLIVLSFQYPYFKKEYTWFGIPVISFDGRNKIGLSRLLLRKKLYQTLKDIHHSSELTGLLSFWYGECAWVGKKFADKHGLKHFCWIMGQDARKENKYVHRIRLKSGELIALSDFLQGEFERNHGIRPQHVIPPGIDTRQFGETPNERDIDIFAAGSLIPLKQYAIFLETVAEIKKRLPHIKAVLAGNGPEKENLQTRIKQTGLEANVSLTGELPYHEVLQLMQRAKTFLHPSSYEGFSGVCLEALYAATHVISFCRPMKLEIENWNVVSSKEEMILKTTSILKNQDTVYKKVLFIPIEEIAKKIGQLFFERK